MRLKILISALGLLLAAPLPLWAAKNDVNIVAVVNGKAITSTMLENRLQLVFSSSNIPDTAETRKRFTGQVLDNLIDETLQQQEARNSNVTVSEEDMKRAITDLEQRNKMPPGSFEESLAKHGINKNSALEQIKARLLWQKLSLKKLRSRVSVSESELREGMEQFTRKQHRREFLLSEIVLQVNDPSKRQEILALAKHIVGEIRKGGEFAIFARQFSASSTALQGGEAGWIPEDRLDQTIAQTVLNTPEKQVTDPIEMPDGSIRIYKVNRRYDPKDAALEVKQLHLPPPIPAEAPEAFVEASRSFQGCDNFDHVAATLKNRLTDVAAANLTKLELGQIKLSDLAAEFRSDVASLSAGQASPVLNKPSGMHIFVVCSRSAESNTLPDEEKVRDLISREKLDLEARRYLNQLRRSAFIEKR